MTERRRLRRTLRIVVPAIFLVLFALTITVVLLVRGSLPILDGERQLEGLDAEVVVSRDHLGVPDIVAGSRLDAARALGYLHAQDRFFQMDLQRRGAAGELSALMGAALLPTDRDLRIHQFRSRAVRVLARLPVAQRELIEAYAQGVNAGLEDLRVRPVEYLVLRRQPEPWRPEDTILTLQAMFLDLSLWSASYEATCSSVVEHLPAGLADLLLPWSNPWDAPLQSGDVAGIEIPDSSEVDVRDWSFGDKSWHEFREETIDTPRQDTAGSNNWAVAGARTTHGGAIVSNDMHLSLRLPNIWYRARMSWPEGEARRAVVGVTLPGTPATVVGSNGDVAWGFTNSQGDWADLVVLEFDAEDPVRYRTPDGWRSIERIPELIEVAGGPADTLWVEKTIWGPVWDADAAGRKLALRWTAHDDEAVNLELIRMESATSVDEVVAMAGTFGIPAQNIVCADRSGRIAWVLAGLIPRRVGWDGRTSVSWSDGTKRWDGYLDPAENPRVIDPRDGQLWTANNRVAAGDDLARIGDGGYSLGARAGQIRDNLSALGSGVTERDLLGVALDDRALLMERWRDLALDKLGTTYPDSLRELFVGIVRDDWSGRADTSSVAFRLVRAFAGNCVENVYDLLTGGVESVDEEFRASWLPYDYAVTWQLIQAEPPHLLAPWFEDWDALVVNAVDQTMRNAVDGGRPIEDYTWGERNRVGVAHPFVQIDARLGRWFAAPTHSLPGDAFMPRVQHPRHGASERMVVSPGREELGIMHMPGGQSGHPWSRHFLAGHEDWERGAATPLLPGPEERRLRLRPQG